MVCVAARTVKGPESILSIRGVFQPAAESLARQVLAKPPKICAVGYFNHSSNVMEDLGLRALRKRVAGIDVHRMLPVVTVLIEQP